MPFVNLVNISQLHMECTQIHQVMIMYLLHYQYHNFDMPFVKLVNISQLHRECTQIHQVMIMYLLHCQHHNFDMLHRLLHP